MVVRLTTFHPTDMIIFGGYGDLSLNKILPALYYRYMDGQLSDGGLIIAVGRDPIQESSYIERVRKALDQVIKKEYFSEESWKLFTSRIRYIPCDVTVKEQYDALAKLLKNRNHHRVFYFALAAHFYGTVCHGLERVKLITPESRVVLEKPIGSSLESFQAIDQAVLEVFHENQVYRIDHYLGKEAVQNLMILRFANNMFGRLWNGDAIDHVQITVSESVGVEQRAGFYDSTGALRDMVQNHLLQLLCLIAMEPPIQLTPDYIRIEKLKVLQSLRPMTGKDVAKQSIRGQYSEGKIAGRDVASFATDVTNPYSHTETYVALKLHLDNWRWSHTPFYLRTGKRLKAKQSEIIVQFRPVPHHIFPGHEPSANRLVIRLQPEETIQLQMMSKEPGPGGYRLRPVALNLNMEDHDLGRIPDAYERLLMDVVRGNPTLFMSSQELEAAWGWVDHILYAWQTNHQPLYHYAAGSDGPSEAAQLMKRDGRMWCS